MNRRLELSSKTKFRDGIGNDLTILKTHRKTESAMVSLPNLPFLKSFETRTRDGITFLENRLRDV